MRGRTLGWRRTAAVAALALGLTGAACSESPAESADPARSADAAVSPTAGGGSAEAAGRGADRDAGRPGHRVGHVVVVSVDGLSSQAIRRLGARRLPHLHRLVREGASTLNARTESEQTRTLPNHTGMVTGRRVDATRGGHGVTWNVHRSGTTVQRAAGHRVSSVFSALDAHGRSAAVFSTKEKFTIFQRSWPRGVDRSVIDTHQWRLVRTAMRDLVQHRRAFTFLHVSLPDEAGHASGGMTSAYLDAVVRSDHQLGAVLATLDSHPRLAADTALVLTADHGFARSHDHSDRSRPANFRVPFLVRGAGARRGADLYSLNPTYRDPGASAPWYAARPQPIRNGDVANLSLDLLGFGPVAGSGIGRAQTLRVR